jgi:putative hydrolase of the HAD superfamily
MSRGIVFDLDDTLIDRTQAVVNFANEFWFESGVQINLSQSDFVSTVLRLDGTGYTPRDLFFQSVIEAFDLTTRQAKQFELRFYDSAWRLPVVLPGTNEALVRLREHGYKLGVVSNGRTEAQLNKLAATGFLPLIDVVLISESFGVKKPDPSIFKAAVDGLAIEPKDSWFVGDHPLNDIWGSKQIGFKTAWVHRNRPWSTEVAPCYDLMGEDLIAVLSKIEHHCLGAP